MFCGLFNILDFWFESGKEQSPFAILFIINLLNFR